MNVNRFLDNTFNGNWNQLSYNSGDYAIFENLPNATSVHAPPVRDLASGGEMLFRKVVVNPSAQEALNVDFYVKGFMKIFKPTEFRVRAILWDQPEKEPIDERGTAIQDIYNRILPRIFAQARLD